MIIKESVNVGDKTITFETGRIAKQAGGSVIVSCGDSMVLVTVCGTKSPRPGISFMPLSVDYVEKTYAAGKIPGGFFKREGRLRDTEVLTCRVIDRPIRPLFPDGYRNEIQVVATVMSADENLTDVLALSGASAALSICPIPWAGPIAGVRVGRVDGKFVANPTVDELEVSECDIIIAASKDALVMVEGECKEFDEPTMQAALDFGFEAAQPTITLIEKIQKAVGKKKWEFESPSRDSAIDEKVKELALDGIKKACEVREKHERYDTFSEVKNEVVAKLEGETPEFISDAKNAYDDLRAETMRSQILDDRTRVDGRDLVTVRPIDIEVGLLPRVHGSSLFTRGETQAIVTATLGTKVDEQRIDGLREEGWKRFLLHYNFPPYSVGEARPMRGPGRREVGHGNLAERALKDLLPEHEDFPYTIRIVSEITESNGSSSMATVCGGALAMMDAGVPLKAPCAGVAMGLIKEGEKYAILTDILGDEDHIGDMDFKVCGTEKGITSIQMDIKIEGLSQEIMAEALTQAKAGRLHILGEMNKILSAGREDLSRYAPKITTLKVKPDQIRVIIGPGGKMIKAIVDQTGAKVDVADDGTVSLAAPDQESVDKAIAIIESLTMEPEVGQKFTGIVRRIENYGAFLEIAPGKDGLLHVTDLAWEFVDSVDKHLNLGDELEVVVSNIDREGRLKLSRKQLLEKPEGFDEEAEAKRAAEARGGRDGGGRSRDRGGRGDSGRGDKRGGRDGDGEKRRRRRRPDNG